MSWVLLALGLFLAVEGLALALAPSRMEEALRLIVALGPERRRMLGLVALALGVLCVWGARLLGALICRGGSDFRSRKSCTEFDFEFRSPADRGALRMTNPFTSP